MSKLFSKKKILFVSGIDFKEKSIQVIRKTPEAYAEHNWEVHYIVGRDKSRFGDYFYEPVINPKGVTIYRFNVPLAFLDEMWNNFIWKAIVFRIRNFLLIQLLRFRSLKLLLKYDFDIIYGYELYGIMALRLLRYLGIGRKSKFVIRFQGVYAGEWARKGQIFRKITNWAYFSGLKTKADLCIMTNDGTQGIDLLNKLGNKTPRKLFLVNGVEPFTLEDNKLQAVKQQFFQDSKVHFISICRLVPQKRVDRSIRIINEVVKRGGYTNLLYSIVGSGAEEQNLKELIEELGLQDSVRFLGSIPNTDVKYYQACADYFFSMDRISNVGNPLLEAIRANKLIITINNGDTGSWIQHNYNGLIYDISGQDLHQQDYTKIGQDVLEILHNHERFTNLKKNLLKTEEERLWTWSQRMTHEVETVENLAF
ncbi:group 1 glycosyl transferase [Chryseotalea sanaruensis]|uniref:Group 1 glycosyl transferase n=1 Tax=Chryseotalea sanaruensis TaxID=2482724 RepID=A0A401UC34_9BACT|nr:glycosyltransferase [Chryseotalea sanaruensis]GCC52466.1 group 1 glycosyl transferase [Chryseotalea sanaruensis]